MTEGIPQDHRHTLSVSVYETTSDRPSVPGALVAVAKEVHRYRWHIWTQFSRSLRGRFAFNHLGTIWALILPVIPVSAYLFLRLVLAPDSSDSIHPALYVGLGVTIWFAFAGLILAPINTIDSQATLLARSHYPLSAAITSNLSVLAMDALTRLVFILPFFLVLSKPSAAGILLSLLVLLAGALFSLGLGCFALLLTLAIPDAKNLIDISLRYLIFLSLAIFPLPQWQWAEWVVVLNPLAIFIDGARSLLILGETDKAFLIAGYSLLGLIVFVLGVRSLKSCERQIRGVL